MLIEEIIFFVIVQVVTGFVVWIICNVDSDNKVNDLEKRIHSTFIKKEESNTNFKYEEMEKEVLRMMGDIVSCIGDLEEKVIQLESNKKKEQEVLNEKNKEEKENVKKQDKFFNEIMDYTYEKAKNVYKTE